jgi:hypothetical protein
MASKKKNPSTARAGNRHKPIFSDDECKEIAAAFDGSTSCIDALWEKWKPLKPGLKRHNIGQAARRGGYEARKPIRRWLPHDDKVLSENRHTMPAADLAKLLDRSLSSLTARHRKLRLGRALSDEFTPRGLEALTAVSSQRWQRLIADGLLLGRHRPSREQAKPAAKSTKRKPAAKSTKRKPVTFISVANLHALLLAHPEVYNYRAAPPDVRLKLGLDALPDPPEWTQVRCTARRSWSRKSRIEGKGARTTDEPSQRKPSCREIGGTTFMARTYSYPRCPRCGCQVPSLGIASSSERTKTASENTDE